MSTIKLYHGVILPLSPELDDHERVVCVCVGATFVGCPQDESNPGGVKE